MTAGGTWLHFLVKNLFVNATASSSGGSFHWQPDWRKFLFVAVLLTLALKA